MEKGFVILFLSGKNSLTLFFVQIISRQVCACTFYFIGTLYKNVFFHFAKSSITLKVSFILKVIFWCLWLWQSHLKETVYNYYLYFKLLFAAHHWYWTQVSSNGYFLKCRFCRLQGWFWWTWVNITSHRSSESKNTIAKLSINATTLIWFCYKDKKGINS